MYMGWGMQSARRMSNTLVSFHPTYNVPGQSVRWPDSDATSMMIAAWIVKFYVGRKVAASAVISASERLNAMIPNTEKAARTPSWKTIQKPAHWCAPMLG